MKTFKQLLLFACLVMLHLHSKAQTPVQFYGEMQVVGNRIHGSKIHRPMHVMGMSFFWSNWSSTYYTAAMVNRMVDEFRVEIVRAAFGVQNCGTPHPGSTYEQVYAIVDQAIARGIYVIIDWHSHGAHLNVAPARNFFSHMAQKYGRFDNVIFEIYNEPLAVPWSTIKNYAEQIIPVIRQHSDNLIVVGTPNWSQDVDQVVPDRITSSQNIAYVLHFYAGTHGQSLRDKGNIALNNGLALKVTEWGSVNADGGGCVATTSTNEWITWMRNNRISSANWSVFDKLEGASMFFSCGENRADCITGITPAGQLMLTLLNNHANSVYAEWRTGTVAVTGVSVSPTSASIVVNGTPPLDCNRIVLKCNQAIGNMDIKQYNRCND